MTTLISRERVRIRNVIHVIALCAGILLWSGCGAPSADGRGSDEVIEHPVSDNIPYVSRAHVPLDTTRMNQGRDSLDRVVTVLSDYLSRSDMDEEHDLDLFVKSVSRFTAASIGENRLAVLDERNNRLLEYDLTADDVVELATKGEGPGELKFSQDMAYDGRFLYIGTPPFYIVSYDCRPSPCEFHETIRLEFSPLSIAGTGESIAVLGDTPLLRGDSIPDPEEDEEIVRLVDPDGTVRDAFGAAYRSPHWIVRNAFMRGAQVRYGEKVDLYAVSFPMLPYVYVYNTRGELAESYEITRFHQRQLTSDGSGVRYASPDGRRSRIRTTAVVGGRVLLVEVVTFWDSDKERQSRHDYFAIELGEGEGYHVGSDHLSLTREKDVFPDRSLYPVAEGLVVNEGGELSFVPLD